MARVRPHRRTRRAGARGRLGRTGGPAGVAARRALSWREQRRLSLDRRTAVLGGIALTTVGAVIAGEVARLLRRSPPGGTPEEGGLEAIGRATRGTVVVAVEGYERTTAREAALFNMLSGFVISFAVVRVSTAGIRQGWWPFANVRMRGAHIHHFVPGILLVFVAGGLAIVSRDQRLESLLAVPFGVGMGLTLDEAALLLQLEDVYWSSEGLISVQISLATAALLGATILARRMLQRGEQAAAAKGSIPAPQ